MLTEIRNTRQINGEGVRRWFTDADNDLIIWFEGDEVTGFQLCYDKFATERAITWFRTGGFTHTKVDSGEAGFGGPKRTPVMVSDGHFDHRSIAERFRTLSKHIDPDLADFVYRKLLEYPR
jgi:hypothetical protein